MAPLGPEGMRRRFDRDAASVNYVYMVYDADGWPCYVGRGRNGRQAVSCKTHGARVEVLASGLTKDEAAELESRLVTILGRRDLDPFGILKNRTQPMQRYRPSVTDIVGATHVKGGLGRVSWHSHLRCFIVGKRRLANLP